MENHLKTHIFVLKSALYWPTVTSNSYIEYAYKILTGIKVLGTVVLYVLIEIITLYYSKNLEEFIEGSFMVFTNMSYLVKLFFLVYNNGKIMLILKEMDLEIFRPKDNKRNEILQNTIRNWRMLFRFYMGICVGTISMWGLLPTISSGQLTLPFNYHYPFDVTASPLREIAYTYETVGLFLVATSHVSMDAFMAGIMAFISAQIDILNLDLCDLHRIEDVNVFPSAAMLVKEQVNCIIFHRQLKRLVRKINELLSISMIAQSMLGAIILCMALYKLSKVATLSAEGLSFINYYVAMLFQLAIYFWYGNEIMWKSSELSKSAYQCNWVSADKIFQKNLLFFLLSTQEPLKVYGGYFLVISLDPLISIIKFSYSCFTLLKSV